MTSKTQAKAPAPGFYHRRAQYAFIPNVDCSNAARGI